MTNENYETPIRAAVIAPGRIYGPGTSLLMFNREAVARRGAFMYPVEWELGTGDLFADDVDDMITERVTAAVKAVASAGASETVIIAKSLGTRAAPVAAEFKLPAIWFTPFLASAPVAEKTIAALRRSTAPFLLVGGTADEFWDGDLARSLTPHVLEIENADHSMFVPGPLRDSAAVLGEVATAVERFLDDVVWPSSR
ncbi:alpha/beta hydrolase [Kitasatospora sp. NPDC052868]|uniref:alpha/beta hydrolase n=1 Tax=Kitasatospora sp. NPDC052868 TaxID=3364060 RepID=UPI0037C75869